MDKIEYALIEQYKETKEGKLFLLTETEAENYVHLNEGNFIILKINNFKEIIENFKNEIYHKIF